MLWNVSMFCRPISSSVRHCRLTLCCTHISSETTCLSSETSYIESKWCLVGPNRNSLWSKIQKGVRGRFWNFIYCIISLTNQDIKIMFSPKCSLLLSTSVQCDKMKKWQPIWIFVIFSSQTSHFEPPWCLEII